MHIKRVLGHTKHAVLACEHAITLWRICIKFACPNKKCLSQHVIIEAHQAWNYAHFLWLKMINIITTAT